MKAAKLLVLLGGILGIIAFFTPLVTGERAGKSISLSAFQVFTGATALKQEVDSQKQVGNLSEQDKHDFSETLAEIKSVVLGCFVPSLVLALVGLVAVIRGKLERLGGLMAGVLGILTLGIWGLLSAGFGETGGEIDKGIAMWLLLAAGLLGTIGGLAALFSPDRGRDPIAG